MKLSEIKGQIPDVLYDKIQSFGILELRPAQEKAIRAEVLNHSNVLVCTPTASGKTLIAEMAMMSAVLNKKGKSIYVVPLRALASEKFQSFTKRYGDVARIALTVSDVDSVDARLEDYDIIICTSEKLDALIRHDVPWIHSVNVVVIDEIHLLNDVSRGPTLEVLITYLKSKIQPQIVGLSATIGNPEQLAQWLNANLVIDKWRPVELREGIFLDGQIEFMAKRK